MRENEAIPQRSRAEPVEPAPAASVILLRGEPLEVLLMRRSDASGFVPGAWVFPGGALDHGDRRLAEAIAGDPGHIEPDSMRICGIRETLEEAGVWLGAPEVDFLQLRRDLIAGRGDQLRPDHLRGVTERLVLTSRWVTPEGMARRYDTWFFLAIPPAGCDACVDGTEGVEIRWMRPGDALAQSSSGELKLVFPTIRNLQALLAHEDPRALLDSRRGAEVPITRPVLVSGEGRPRIVLPEEEGA